jgi:hypothetical protein
MERNIASRVSILMRARDFIPSFADIAINEDGTIKPMKPLDADQLRRRSKRQTAAQQKVQDENARHASKLRDLQGKLA